MKNLECRLLSNYEFNSEMVTAASFIQYFKFIVQINKTQKLLDSKLIITASSL